MVLLNPIPSIIANKVIQTKIAYNLPEDSFLYMYKVDHSEKIISFIENRNINGLIIIVWRNEFDLVPKEQLVVIKLYHKIGTGTFLNPNELAICLQIQQLDSENYEIKSVLSTNRYIYNLKTFSIKDFEVIRGRLYDLKKYANSELAYCIATDE